MIFKHLSKLILIISISCSSKNSTNTSVDNLETNSNKTKVMLLGVWHFDNPGQDKYNSEVDDYFSSQRQKEIAEVLNKLEKFDANKIFIEQNHPLKN